MAAATVIDLKNATVKLQDGAGTPASLTINIGEGTLSFTITRNIEYRRNRGKLSGGVVREGDEEPVSLSLQAVYNHLKSDSGDPKTVYEFLTQQGNGSSLTTTGAACEPYAVDLIVELDTDCGSVEDEVLTFPQFRYEEISGDLKAGEISFSGKANAVFPTAVRSSLDA